jgi:Ca2+-binding EF-hand superfamily protein
MESQDYINFESLRKFINIEDQSLLTTYLKEVFKDLSDRGDSNKKKGISKITFLEYIKLPIFIAEKVFQSFDLDNDGFLNLKEFVDNLASLYLGDFNETIKIIFNIFDFDKDGDIIKGDVKILLSYLPLKTEKNKVEYKFQIESFEEIDEIIRLTFVNLENLKLEEFKKIIETKKSDIFLQMLCFLYYSKPFSDTNINMLRSYKRRSPEVKANNSPLVSSPAKNLPSPNKKSIFFPIDQIFKLNLVENDEEDPEPKKKSSHRIDVDNPTNNFDKDRKKININNADLIGKNADMIRMSNQKITVEKSDDINSNIKYSKNIFSSPSVILKRKDKTKLILDFNLEDNLVKMEDLSIKENQTKSKPISTINENPVLYEDWIYKLSESNKIKKYWLVLVGKDIYYYRSEKKDDLLGMHNLSGSFVRETGQKKISNETLLSFAIQFSSKSRNYYTYIHEACEEWVKNIKEAIGYKSFFDFYDMQEDIGEGKFGVVKLGVHKKTKEKVAIKIIKKESMNTSDIELVKSEIDIMKLCRHPNIVTLLDHFENSEYIFIIMELSTGGDLEEHFHKTKFKFTEPKAAIIMFQLASGIKYLHDYGVLHRDLKPENIMLSDNTDKATIKIMDFGLSKIIGPQERVADGFGTLSFVAPEVLIRQPYNKQIDIWSLGVILYYMLSGTLPFDDENDNEEIIAKMTVFTEVQFPSKYWSKRGEDVIDLIKKCLIKNPEERIKIDEYLQQKWIKAHNK